MKIINSTDKVREIEVLAEKLPDMLLQQNRLPYSNSVAPQSGSNNGNLYHQNQGNAVRNIYTQSNIRPRKGKCVSKEILG